MPSEKILEQKKQQVSELCEAFKGANVGVLVNYSGISVEKDTKLRKELREAGCEYKVVKNTLLSRAFQEAGIDGLDEHLKGSTAIAYSDKGYTEAPQILSDYIKANPPAQGGPSGTGARRLERPHPGHGQCVQRRAPQPGYCSQRHCREAVCLIFSSRF